MLKLKSILCAGLLCLAVAACSKQSPAASDQTPEPGATAAVVAVAETSTPTSIPTITPTATFTTEPTATPTPAPPPTATPSPTATPTSAPVPPPTLAPTNTPCPADGCPIPPPAPASKSLADTENILLMGSDLRPDLGAKWRTDTMVLVAIDRKNDQVGIISFPRDYLVYIPPHDGFDEFMRTRINEVDFEGVTRKHAGGGFGLLKDVFEYNFGIRLDRFARLHRPGFVQVVDILGGVDVSLECELWELSPKPEGEEGYLVFHLPAGKHHLDGDSALKFATWRYNSADWDRSRRQQQFMLAVRDQLLRAGTFTKIPELWATFKDYFATDLGLIDLIRLAAVAKDIDLNNVHARVIGYREMELLPNKSGAYIYVSKGDAVHDAIESLFSAGSITAQSKPDFGCPPTPKWAKDYMTPAPPPVSTPTPEPPPLPEPSPTP